jgi:hypothetical protein
MNIDYSICNALSYHTEGFTECVVVYDIACEWLINFFKRLATSHHLSIPDLLKKILAAVGKFHLSAHVEECFVQFSLNFLLGVGQVDGEILETLWSSFNLIARSARSMSKAHRREVYDDFFRDGNWKKLVGSSM